MKQILLATLLVFVSAYGFGSDFEIERQKARKWNKKQLKIVRKLAASEFRCPIKSVGTVMVTTAYPEVAVQIRASGCEQSMIYSRQDESRAWGVPTTWIPTEREN